jgi:hypothetical protein
VTESGQAGRSPLASGPEGGVFGSASEGGVFASSFPGSVAENGFEAGGARVIAAGLRNVVSALFPGASESGPTIPLLGPGSTWVPQGLAWREEGDQLLSTFYDSENVDGNGMLAVQDRESGEVLRTVELSGTSTSPVGAVFGWGDHGPRHLGGVAIDGDHVWVTSTEEDGAYLYRYSMRDIERAADGEAVDYVSRTSVAAGSYATFAEGKVWVGSFSEDGPGELFSYEVRVDGTLDPRGTFEGTTPSKAQGLVVRDDELIFSRSYGRTNPSTITRVPRTSNPLTRWLGTRSVEAPNMAEGIALVPGVDGTPELYTTYESGATEYADPSATDEPEKLDPRTTMTRVELD